MRLVYLVLSLAPRWRWSPSRGRDPAVSVRVVWRESAVRRMDNEPA